MNHKRLDNGLAVDYVAYIKIWDFYIHNECRTLGMFATLRAANPASASSGGRRKKSAGNFLRGQNASIRSRESGHRTAIEESSLTEIGTAETLER